MSTPRSTALIGPVEIGPVAHGGHCVARIPDPSAPSPSAPDSSGPHASGADASGDAGGSVGDGGRVVFVRHCLPGERVMIRLTDDSHARFWRADAVEVVEPAPDRVTPPCPVSGPGMCGGCDFQHVALPGQRRLKAQVVAEQLERLAGIEWTGEVEDVGTAGTGPDGAGTGSTADGLGWRTRMRYHAGPDGRAGLRRHRSHEVVALPEGGCPIAAPRTPSVVDRSWPEGAELLAAGGARGRALFVDGRLESGDRELAERAAGRDWSVAADGFWQVHPEAAATLTTVVAQGLDPQPGETAFDLYCGVGLFSGVLADAGCEVWGVESGHQAVQAARRNLADVAGRVHLSTGRVEARLPQLPARADLVVLDPPRSGAGRSVMRGVAARRPRAIAYVACDPAALARDLATASGAGYRTVAVRAFDLFPMTHHVECVALLVPSSDG